MSEDYGMLGTHKLLVGRTFSERLTYWPGSVFLYTCIT